jgi:hypothetical protein
MLSLLLKLFLSSNLAIFILSWHKVNKNGLIPPVCAVPNLVFYLRNHRTDIDEI